MVVYNVKRSMLDSAVKVTPGLTSPTILALEDKEWVSVTAMTKIKEVSAVMDALEDLGATGIAVMDISNCRR
eukprot:g809.t1